MLSEEQETEIFQTIAKGAAKLNQHYSDIKEKYTEEVYKKIPINISFNASIGNMTLKINDKLFNFCITSKK